MKERDLRGLRLAPLSTDAKVAEGGGWNHWRAVWAAWCPTCNQETMPFPSGRCAFCDAHLQGQLARGPYDPHLTAGDGEESAAAMTYDRNRNTILKAA